MIPTRQMCEKLWNDMRLDGGLKNHMAAVADLSVRIGKALNKNGYNLNIPLIEAAALLHDIEKGKTHHAAIGAKALEEMGFGDVAPIVKAHMRLPYGFVPEITEFTVVFLSDKMFIGSKAVSLESRYGERLCASHDQPVLNQIIRDQLDMSLKLEKHFKTVLNADDILKLL